MLAYEQIFKNNVAWLESKKVNEEDFFRKLATDQNPDYLYIGCSDSRVTAEDMMGAEPGEVFVHRNIANMVISIDLNVMSVIEYAVKFLEVKHIIVCGHYNCGGVKAAMTPKDLGLLNPWLRNIRDVYRIHRKELDVIEDPKEKYDRLVELNVQEQCINVVKTAVFQEKYLHDGYPQVHGWVFDVRKGRLVDLKIDFDSILKDIQKIYDLTGQ